MIFMRVSINRHVSQKQWVEKPEEGCCGDDADGKNPPAPAVGDMSIGAVIDGLRRKLSMMRQEFRVVRNKFQHGDPRKIKIVVNPRGPPGFTGKFLFHSHMENGYINLFRISNARARTCEPVWHCFFACHAAASV
jgi:hypothetical protein